MTKPPTVPVVDKWQGTKVSCPHCSYVMTLQNGDKDQLVQEEAGWLEYKVVCPRGGEAFVVREKRAQ